LNSLAVELRRATAADAPAMALAHVDSIRSLGPSFYEPRLVEAWAAAVTPDMYIRAMAEGEVFFIALGAVDGEPAVLGFASHRPDGGDDGASVYVRGSAARRGIGSALWAMAEAHARAHGAGAITIEASLPGVEFYRRHGFLDIERSGVQMSGETVPCVVMRKPLTAR
jgi:putative acetyltransferase